MLKSLKSIAVLMAIGLIGEPEQPQNSLSLPMPGFFEMRLLTPDLLEVSLVNTKEPAPEPVQDWDFVGKNNQFSAPKKTEFKVTTGDKPADFSIVGFRRRPIYAPLKNRDLRIGNYLYLKLDKPISTGQTVQVENPNGEILPKGKVFTAKADPSRWNPALHVNQEGYLASYSKKAFVGYYLGSGGELDTSTITNFNLVDIISGKSVFQGPLQLRKDVGYTYTPKPYQNVMEADFSIFKTPGEYQLQVAGMGTSFPFHITDDTSGLLARTFAMGLYNQRCGVAHQMPFTRFTQGACHTALAEVPTMKFETVNSVLDDESKNFSGNPRHTAPQLKSVDASLYPFVNRAKLDVSGGHHDAGDYSKYTINSAHLIHVLVFAADVFPNAGDLDNLGLPESGDKKSDLLQEAKWESDFLCKMQDADGGFYFLVYPRDRQYEHDVLPDQSDPQVVFPKTTAVTAAAVAALAQAASSPLFKAQFPEAATNYLNRAKRGWQFLEKAFAKHGRDGSYQKITHYGDEFMHDDEIAWAATELYLATGEEKYHKELIEHFDPAKMENRRWNWWRMFEAYGCAIRSYAFAVKTKRLQSAQIDDHFFQQCENEIIANAEDLSRYSDENAYGTSFPSESKRFRNAGWYFSSDAAFDLAAACCLNYPEMNDPRPHFIEALISNFDYELGNNPVNVSFVAGLGWKRPREIVHQYAQNDRRVLPQTGLPWGNIQEGFAYLEPYKKELGDLTFPPDWDEKNPYPFYDRWGDSFNTTTECVTVNIGRALAASSFLMGRTPLKSQPWKAAPGEIRFLQETNQTFSAELKVAGLDPSQARLVWEMNNQEPKISTGKEKFVFRSKNGDWVEVEATWPDGKRVVAAGVFLKSAVVSAAK